MATQNHLRMPGKHVLVALAMEKKQQVNLCTAVGTFVTNLAIQHFIGDGKVQLMMSGMVIYFVNLFYHVGVTLSRHAPKYSTHTTIGRISSSKLLRVNRQVVQLG